MSDRCRDHKWNRFKKPEGGSMRTCERCGRTEGYFQVGDEEPRWEAVA